MTLQSLRCFAAVAKNLSFAEAAKQLYISQPAVTHQIKQLENDLGIRLFDRGQRLVRLTPAGTMFYAEVREILQRLDSAVEQVRRDPQFTENLTIGCRTSLRSELLPQIYREFQKTCPNVRVNVMEILSLNQQELFQNNGLDLVFSYEYTNHCPPGVSFTKLYKGHFCCVLPQTHPLAQKSEITAADLTGETLIFLAPEKCSSVMEQLQSFLRRECRDIHIYLSSSAIHSTPMICGGLGIAVMPNFICPTEPDLAAIPFRTDVKIEYGIAWHSYDTSEKVKQFIRIAKRLYAEKYGNEILR